MREYQGDFEVHVSVRADKAETLEQFQQWCAHCGYKCVHILLSRGDHANQPMATWRRGGTILPSVLEEANSIAQELEEAGISVTRVKIEAAPANAEVPLTNEEARTLPAHDYFEHHVKILRKEHSPRDALVTACESLGAHLSRNAFRQPALGFEERFVTLRSYQVGRETSLAELQQLLALLDELGEQVIEHESEYCVYDSNLALDDGWLPESA